MLLRTLLTYTVITTCAAAFHDNTFAVFELREHLLMLTMNLWELFGQLEYAHPELRARVYQEIGLIQREIDLAIRELMRLDQLQHPTPE
jgi:hypothetical protein|tara:strand:+ start:306 stop:572 length:267 start_codon:yes stop_codon:yes gene_type:complete